MGSYKSLFYFFFNIYVNTVIGAHPYEKGGKTFSRGSVIIRKSVTVILPLSVHFPIIDRYTKDAQIQSPESASLGYTSGEVLLPKSGLELGKS